ncbi:ankyrin repeat domain-containing protein 49 isoform X5 [Perca flavescens]|uniref:ankyrin repeat domain-containing protein 49 isoform X5 n=1 Tax=Perca flavescens TaxID=8167 RepID=UPI00106ED233|nr:ankyrin repeat domain-containing protein 49 isoform X5 [Perca flavescens]
MRRKKWKRRRATTVTSGILKKKKLSKTNQRCSFCGQRKTIVVQASLFAGMVRPQQCFHCSLHTDLSTVHRLLAADPLLVHCCDEDGYTPLHRAAYSGHVAVVSALIAAGSKVNPRTIDGWTPLHSACRWSRVTVASFLLQHGAELNAQTNGGLTPLHLAASNTTPFSTDSPSTLELLLSQRHLNPGLRSGSGETASEVARRTGPHHVLFEMVQDCVNVVPFS